MIKSKDVKLFHELNLEREIIPSNYELFHTNNNKVKQDNIIHSIFKSTGNISRTQENQFIYTNPNKEYYVLPNKNKIIKTEEKYKFKFNNVINIEKNKIMTYFLCNNFEELFSLFELYIENLFNGINIELIPGLFQRELITDSVYINVMKCIEIN